MVFFCQGVIITQRFRLAGIPPWLVVSLRRAERARRKDALVETVKEEGIKVMEAMKEMVFSDGTRITISESWWRHDKYQDENHTSGVYVRGEKGGGLVAGYFENGEDVPKIEAKYHDISPWAMHDIGLALCRALYDVKLEGE